LQAVMSEHPGISDASQIPSPSVSFNITPKQVGHGKLHPFST